MTDGSPVSRHTVLATLAGVIVVLFFLTSSKQEASPQVSLGGPISSDEQHQSAPARIDPPVRPIGAAAGGPLGLMLVAGQTILEALSSRPRGAPVDTTICAVGSSSRLSQSLRDAFPSSIVTVFDPKDPPAGANFVTHEVQQVDDTGRSFAYFGRLSYSMVGFLTVFPTRKCTLVVLEGGAPTEPEADVSNIKSMAHEANCVVASKDWGKALAAHPRWRSLPIPVEAQRAISDHESLLLGRFATGRLPFPSAELEAVLHTGAWRDVDLRPFDKVGNELTKSAQKIDPEVEGHSAQLILERQMYIRLARLPQVKTICEIGFNAGHSAALWLLANPNAKVIMFDIFIHTYSKHNENFIRGSGHMFGLANADARLTTVVGSSLDTVVEFANNHSDIVCDIVSVDGYHDHNVALFDLAHMRRLANPAFHILVVDDTNCNYGWWCVHKAVLQREFRGDVEVLARVGEHPWAPDRGYARGLTVLQYTQVPANGRKLPVSKEAADM